MCEGMGLHGLEWNSGSAQGPLVIVGPCGGLHFTLPASTALAWAS